VDLLLLRGVPVGDGQDAVRPLVRRRCLVASISTRINNMINISISLVCKNPFGFFRSLKPIKHKNIFYDLITKA
jgi:hypothetical protein